MTGAIPEREPLTAEEAARIALDTFLATPSDQDVLGPLEQAFAKRLGPLR